MAQDLKKLFERENKLSKLQMPKGHEARFLNKLDNELPVQPKKTTLYSFIKIAASLVILLGLGFGAYSIFEQPIKAQKQEVETKMKTLGDISPDLKKVEDYYLANINLELSKVKLTPENKELFDGYVTKLEELNNEYQKLSVELTQNGPNELTVSALIDNLKFRLNLLYRLKEQLQDLNDSDLDQETS
jgi:vacuolar-type H+-ATPase subunit I/STV1